MSPSKIDHSRRRLWLGISNVGFWVLAAGGGLTWLQLRDIWSLEPGFLLQLIGVVLVVQSLFDLIGGWVLSGPPRVPFVQFLASWGKGILTHSALLALIGTLYYWNFKLTQGFLAAVICSTLLLAFGRMTLLRLIGARRLEHLHVALKDVLFVDTKDPAFTGGITGFGSKARIVLPSHWLRSVPMEELATEIFRRKWQIERGLPLRSLVLILIWNMTGCVIASVLLNLPTLDWTAALLGLTCAMTLWGFLGLLILPAASRFTVFAGDMAAAAAGLDVRAWIRRYPELVTEDGSGHSLVEKIFYPVPSASTRLNVLSAESAKQSFIPGSLARNNLYYSWATLSLLGRSVHCNAGRPALWVFPPST